MGAPVGIEQIGSYINGEVVQATTGEFSELVDPSTGQVFALAGVCGPQDVDAAYRAATEAFQTWGETTPAERQVALLRIADVLEANAAELVELESRNTGKPIPVTMAEEIPPMIDQIRFFAGAARVLEGRSAGST